MKAIVKVLLISLFFTYPTMAFAADKPGGTCSKTGAVTTISKTKYVCQVSNKKTGLGKSPSNSPRSDHNRDSCGNEGDISTKWLNSKFNKRPYRQK
jgi:hypothetical protein